MPRIPGFEVRHTCGGAHLFEIYFEGRKILEVATLREVENFLDWAENQ